MSQIENPVETVIRLLARNMSVVKDDGSPANISVSREWLSQEALQNVDGHVTVGLLEAVDNKLELTGRLRRRLVNLRVNVWSLDSQMRFKIVEEVNRIVRQNRNKPNETFYGFAGVGQATGTYKAYSAGASSELSPNDAGWSELSDVDYEKIWYSDDQRYSKSHSVNGEYALMLFRFKVESRKQTVKKIVLAFEGYGTASAGNGVTIKVWNHVASAWQNAQSGMGGADETISITLTSNLTDYIDDDGYVWLLARTTNPSDGTTAAVLYCDYVSCTVTVNGITYLDVVSFRDADRVDVKPFVYHTEMVLKSWVLENLEV